MMDPKDRPTLGKERFAEIKAKVLALRTHPKVLIQTFGLIILTRLLIL